MYIPEFGSYDIPAIEFPTPGTIVGPEPGALGIGFVAGTIGALGATAGAGVGIGVAGAAGAGVA